MHLLTNILISNIWFWLGIPENRIAPLTLPSPIEIVVNGNTLNVKTGSRSQEFTLGVEFNETFSKDYIGKSTTQLEGNKLVTKTIMPEGHTMTRTTELTPDGGIIHVSVVEVDG